MAAVTSAMLLPANGVAFASSGVQLNSVSLKQQRMSFAPLRSSMRRRLHTTAEFEEDSRKMIPTQVKEVGKKLQSSVAGTKQTVNEQTVRDNMQNNEAEKKSVFGVEPSSGGFYPRPEIERRPETGDRSFQSVLAFDGAAPETINGRLAMIGFFWGVLAEMQTHKPIIAQLTDPSGFTDGIGRGWFILAALVVFGASLIPIFNGESTDSRRFAAFTAKAERWNGRVAMLGFAGLIIVESALGHSFF